MTSSTYPPSPTRDRILPGKSYLLGQNIAHSLSPRFHRQIYSSLGLSWTFDLRDTSNATDVVQLIRQPDFVGASVTMPHKVAVIQHLDKLTEAAQLTQAVNAIYVQEDATTGKRAIVGTNTDYIGIHDAIIAADPIMVERAKGRPGLVIGGGGACRAAVYALRTMMQCSEVYLVNRDARELEQVMISFKETGFDARCACVQTQDEALVLEAPVVIVGTIPDHRPQSDDEVRAREITSILFERASQLEATFLDMCYSPSPETQLMFIARSKGLNVVSGIDAFFYQAIASNSLWTKVAARDLPVEKARELVYTHLV